MILKQKVDELKAYIDKWAADVRQELKLPDTGHSIGISFEPSVTLSQVPSEEPIVAAGFYQPRSGTGPSVEVVSPVHTSSLVFFQVTFESGTQALESISAGMFNVLYEPVPTV